LNDRKSKDAVVEAVIVNWNAGEYIRRCIDTLFGCHSSQQVRAIVVDNASSDCSVAELEGRSDVRLIANGSNRGFAAAVNQGLAALSTDTAYVLVLNPDMEFSGDVLSGLLDFFDQNPRAGVLTARIDNPDGSLQPTCRRREPSPWSMLCRLSGLANLFPHSDFFAGYTYGGTDPGQAHPVEAVSGSFMLIRREVLAEVESFDERYFMYAEDLEFCHWVRRAGWEIWYVPLQGAVHHGGVCSSHRAVRSLWHKHCTACRYLNSTGRHRYPALLRWSLSAAVMGLFPPRALWVWLVGRFR
jgi:GT2 family glycosyltransferase